MAALEGGVGSLLATGSAGDAASSLPTCTLGHSSSGRLGLAPGLWQRRTGVSLVLLGQPSKTGSLLQPEKLGHVHHLLCHLKDLYMSSLLKIKFKICIQRC